MRYKGKSTKGILGKILLLDKTIVWDENPLLSSFLLGALLLPNNKRNVWSCRLHPVLWKGNSTTHCGWQRGKKGPTSLMMLTNCCTKLQLFQWLLLSNKQSQDWWLKTTLGSEFWGSGICTGHIGSGLFLFSLIWGFRQAGTYTRKCLKQQENGVICRLLHSHSRCVGWEDSKAGLSWSCWSEYLHTATP